MAEPVLRPEEVALLRALPSKPGHSALIAELTRELNIDQSLLTAGAQNLARSGWVTIDERQEPEISRGPQWQEKLPERVALEKLAEHPSIPLSQLPLLLNKPDVRSEIKYLLRKGWCVRDADTITVTPQGKEALAGELLPDEKIVLLLKEQPAVALPEIKETLSEEEFSRGLSLLKGRDEIVKVKMRTRRTVTLTPAGEEAVKRLPREAIKPEITQLTPELLVSGRWREVSFRRYDVTLPARPLYPGKRHPLMRIIQEARRAFLEMGFEEVSSPVVETAFWDFDALFQPQDHPAREMQDTFYLAKPEKGKLPDEEIVKRVAATHEYGGDTGSKGWRYQWDRTRAEKPLLRTHTTAATIRALAENPQAPRKVFCIGKVYRRENIDATHLPEFIQIDGIIIDDQASLVTLFGTLAEFYRKMGAAEVRFRPSYFPYTEPSVEVFAHLGALGWVEMGGAGVFRPEVVRPLGCRSKVLAWGLGLERLAMMRFGISDIRRLYFSDIAWLRAAKEEKRCR